MFEMCTCVWHARHDCKSIYDLCHTWYSEFTSVDYRSCYFYHKYTFSVCSKCVARNKRKIHAHALAQKHKHTDQIYKSPHFTELTYVEWKLQLTLLAFYGFAQNILHLFHACTLVSAWLKCTTSNTKYERMYAIT